MATEKTDKGTSTAVVSVKPTDIFVRSGWNMRSPGYQKNASDVESWGEFVDSIRPGVQVPLDVVVDKGPNGEHYRLVNGERRRNAAIEAKLDSVPVIVRAYRSPAEERLSHILNNNQEKPSGLDLAYAIGDLCTLMTVNGNTPSQVVMARALGYKQPYVGMLLRIVQQLLPDIFEAARTGALKIPIKDLYEWSAKNHDAQRAAYQNYLEKQAKREAAAKESGIDPSKDGSGAKGAEGKKWLEGLQNKAQVLGMFLAECQRHGLVKYGPKIAEGAADEASLLAAFAACEAVKVPEKADAAERTSIVRCFESGMACPPKVKEDKPATK